ncbi:uncharacterized protein PG998_012719 [Apiospora kogelbergensis]|uniref:Uncharacterized protein n=1 Tax=Apiospora kogelbergensis TaxID=1337665 RepID=A0AAW0Q5G9_9PEZI
MGLEKTPANVNGSWTDTEGFNAQPDGQRAHEALSSSLHEHVIRLKANLDGPARPTTWFASPSSP